MDAVDLVTQTRGDAEMPRKDTHATAEYFASMCEELADLAGRNGFDLGAYLLKMASLEFAKQTAPAKHAVLQ